MPRQVVHWFSEIMEQKLQENDYKGGWAAEKNSFLLKRLREEVGELVTVLLIPATGDNAMRADAVAREAADVANIAMMIADNYHRNSVLSTTLPASYTDTVLLAGRKAYRLSEVRQYDRFIEIEMPGRGSAFTIYRNALKFLDIRAGHYVSLRQGTSWDTPTGVFIDEINVFLDDKWQVVWITDREETTIE